MNEIEELIKAIGVKHGCYCTFTIAIGHTNGKTDSSKVGYQSYISGNLEKGFNHKKHDSIEDTCKRFNDYFDLPVDKTELIKNRIECLNYSIQSSKNSIELLKEELKDYD